MSTVKFEYGKCYKYKDEYGDKFEVEGNNYLYAVCVSINPLILVSPDGHMKWEATLKPEHLVEVPVKGIESRIEAFRRHTRDLQGQLMYSSNNMDDHIEDCVGVIRDVMHAWTRYDSIRSLQSELASITGGRERDYHLEKKHDAGVAQSLHWKKIRPALRKLIAAAKREPRTDVDAIVGDNEG